MKRPHQLYDKRYWPDPDVAPEDDASAEGLLEVAQHVRGMLAGAFGRPEEIARGGPLTAVVYRDLARWIAGLEELVRCILFLIALTFAPRLRSRPEAPCHGEDLDLGVRPASEPFDPNDPGSWRFSFRYLPRAPRAAANAAPRAVPAGPRHRKDPDAPRDASPLARRWESICRILTEPMLYAETLAERLQTLQRPIDIREEQPRACRRKGGRAANPCSSAMARAQRRAGAMLRDWLPPPEFWSSA